ncbi:efflux RND transporter periplasmic adaptor subunit [Massilia sp. W12]|uniref:efflux RND transporter periplasmic adaptor subunit n=1 Tax=Massilia sp. W12 TaxID=3126507 RepID=UPI0030D50668
MQSKLKALLRHPHTPICALIVSLSVGGLFLLPSADAAKSGHADHAGHAHETEGAHGKPEQHEKAASHAKSAPPAASAAHTGHAHDDKQAAHAHDEEETQEVAMNAQQIKLAGLRIARVENGPIRSMQPLPAEILLDEARTAHLTPRLSGVILSVHANLGQRVRKGQVLAILQSAAAVELQGETRLAQQRLQLAQQQYAREKMLWEQKISATQDYQQAAHQLREAELQLHNARQKMQALGLQGEADASRIALRAPQDGLILERHATVGEAVKEEQNLFTIADLSQVWAEVEAPARDMALLKQGAAVRVSAAGLQAHGVLDWVGVQLREQNRSAKARVRLANPELAWRPGVLAQVEVENGAQRSALSVESEALQEIDGKPSLFIRSVHGFRAHSVQTGRSDGRRTEILAGLQAGQEYVAGGSFVLKSELGKAAAAHSH